MIKPKKSFAALIAITLMLALAYSATARSRVAPGRNVAVASPQEPDTRKLEDAGLQFEVPKGWKVENNDGNVMLSVADGAVSVTFVIAEDYEKVVVGMKDGLKEKLTEVKSDADRKTETHNGMVHIEESGSGLMEGVKVTWSIDVLKAKQNVTLLTFGVEKVLQEHIEEYLKFVGSLKKIQ